MSAGSARSLAPEWAWLVAAVLGTGLMPAAILAVEMVFLQRLE